MRVHGLCRGGCPLAQTWCEHQARSTCHAPARPRTTAGCPAVPARGIASLASSILPTLASARRYKPRLLWGACTYGHTWQSLVRLHLFMLCSPSLPQEEACHAWHVNNMSISNQTCNAPLRCGPQPFVPNLNFDEGISRSSGAASHQWHSQSAGGRSCRCSSSRWRLQR